MAIAIGLCLYLQRYLVSGFFRRLGFAVLTAGLIAALSRGPWVGAVVILFVWIVTGRHAATRLVKLAMLVVPLLMVLAVLPGGQTVINLIPFIGETERENIDYRGSLFDNSLPVIMRNPLFGSPDYINSPEMEAMRQGQGIIDVVNTYLQIALAYGLVTLFFFVAIFMSIGLKLLVFLRRSPDTSAEPVELCRSILAIICGIMVTIATVSSVSYVPIVYWCFAGVGSACMLSMSDWRHRMLDPKHKRAF
jgi:O-antigen ligase